MAKDVATFVAEDLWLFVAIATFFLAGLLSIIGFNTVVALTAFVGWFFLTPVLLFWGDEIAAWLYGSEPDDAAWSSEPSATNLERQSEDDPLEHLKYRYATGELSDEEFERRLERLVEVDDRYVRRDEGTREPSGSDREFERERT